MRTVKLTESETLFIEARIADVLHHSESSNGVKRLAQNVLDSIAQSEPDTTERGPDRKPTIHVEPGALNHIRVFALVQFMVAQGLEMVQKDSQLVIRRKRGNAGKGESEAGEFPPLNIEEGIADVCGEKVRFTRYGGTIDIDFRVAGLLRNGGDVGKYGNSEGDKSG